MSNQSPFYMVFWKYQGAGNDFVLIDQRRERWIEKEDRERIAHLCDRRFGIGADGLILLEAKEGYDFEMVYFNADGRESTMCGNGGRCIAAFARGRGAANDHCHFLAIDGPHEAWIYEMPKRPETVWVELKMADVPQIARDNDNTFVLNTGSPHYVRFVPEVENFPVVAEGSAVRYSGRFRDSGGINANFVEVQDAGLRIRTYERGVEDETLACGTGITAAALAWHIKTGREAGVTEVAVQASGDHLRVRFAADGREGYNNIWLCGPATEVFEGNYKTF